MRIVISGIEGAQPLVLDGLSAAIVVAADGANRAASPCVTNGRPAEIMALASIALMDIRKGLGDAAFEDVIRVAREHEVHYRVEDVTDAVKVRG